MNGTVICQTKETLHFWPNDSKTLHVEKLILGNGSEITMSLSNNTIHRHISEIRRLEKQLLDEIKLSLLFLFKVVEWTDIAFYPHKIHSLRSR